MNARAIGVWAAVVVLTTLGLIGLRDVLDKAHVALVYLLVVLAGSARLGRRGGVALAILCFFSFNFFLITPYHTLLVADPLDWLVLIAFLLTSLVAAQLLYRAQQEASSARQRSEDIN